jgi:hypothetical protein
MPTLSKPPQIATSLPFCVRFVSYRVFCCNGASRTSSIGLTLAVPAVEGVTIPLVNRRHHGHVLRQSHHRLEARCRFLFFFVTGYEVTPHGQGVGLSSLLLRPCKVAAVKWPAALASGSCFCSTGHIVAASSGSLPFLPPDVHATMPNHPTALSSAIVPECCLRSTYRSSCQHRTTGMMSSRSTRKGL